MKKDMMVRMVLGARRFVTASTVGDRHARRELGARVE